MSRAAPKTIVAIGSSISALTPAKAMIARTMQYRQAHRQNRHRRRLRRRRQIPRRMSLTLGVLHSFGSSPENFTTITCGKRAEFHGGAATEMNRLARFATGCFG